MARKSKSSRKRQAPSVQSYYFDVIDWRPYYSFALGNDRLTEGPYREHTALELRAKVLIPKKHADRVAEITLLGRRSEDQDLDQPDGNEGTPLAVGRFTIRGERCEYLGSIPQTAVWGLIPAFQSGRFVTSICMANPCDMALRAFGR